MNILVTIAGATLVTGVGLGIIALTVYAVWSRIDAAITRRAVAWADERHARDVADLYLAFGLDAPSLSEVRARGWQLRDHMLSRLGVRNARAFHEALRAAIAAQEGANG